MTAADILMSSLDPPERNRLRDLMRAKPRTEDERARTQRLDAILARVEADIRAARDVLGIYDSEDADDAARPPS